MQKVQTWLQGIEPTDAMGHAEAGPAAADKGVSCNDPHSSANHEADLVGDFGLDDAFDDAEFTLVQSKRKKGKQAVRPGQGLGRN